ncbi:hypothetical protein F4809DRAFT_567601 [Biscogniauxia mediterranea]|nr:hypothetical protein F4809DRAFT_567601 [Biscogniauxia mediterranea]
MLEGQESAERVIRATLAALIINRLQLEAFCITFCLGKKMIWSTDLVYPARLLQQLRACFSSITTLRLTIGAEVVNEPPPSADSSIQFITLFSGLRRLELYFHCSTGCSRLTSIAGSLHIPGLRSLVIQTVSCTLGDLTNLLLRHRDTLEEIEIYTVNLISSPLNTISQQVTITTMTGIHLVYYKLGYSPAPVLPPPFEVELVL